MGGCDAGHDPLALIGGEKIIVREILDELIAFVIEFRRSHPGRIGGSDEPTTTPIGDPPRVSLPPRRQQSDVRYASPPAPLGRGEGR